ncbi:MAG: glucose-6-phosphate isomerase [Acholeplasmatales bacterium]|jgi:glucose-6-phosphate isomerase|nr:glucose-6-phosphate isomerase [Acholeplasmatales bacterium]
MKEKITVNKQYLLPFLKEDYHVYQAKVKEIHNGLIAKTLLGSDFLGWLDLPVNPKTEEINFIKDFSKKIRKEKAYLVVIGIGGSYLGAKAAISFLAKPFSSSKVIFAGYNTKGEYLEGLCKFLQNKDFYINIISKSGTTLEPALSFRVIKNLLAKKYPDTWKERIVATTDKARGALYTESVNNGYTKLVIEDNVGGRYSVLSAVGLLAASVYGINIDKLLKGALDAYKDLLNPSLDKNDAYFYAVARYMLYKDNKVTELLINYDESLNYLSEWSKQLFCESEGKDKKGLLVGSMSYTTDLHSLGQYVQDGLRNVFETIYNVENVSTDYLISEDDKNYDKLNSLAGKHFKDITGAAMQGVINAHTEGGVPNIIINIPSKNAYCLGYLFYFLEKACAISAHLLEVNPFNQPGVESYKKEMFKLLGLLK